MMAETSEIMKLIVRFQDAASAGLKALSRSVGGLPGVVDKAKASFQKLQTRLGAVKNAVFSLQGMLLGLGVGMAASNFLDVAASFEDMEIKLEALTKGKGKETLDEINAWAMTMPVNTRKAVDSFSMMMAMGLDPTTREKADSC